MSEMREAFEKWGADSGFRYVYGEKNWAWEAWQAAWNTRADQGGEAVAVGYADPADLDFLKRDTGQPLGCRQAILYSRANAHFVMPVYTHQPHTTTGDDARDAVAYRWCIDNARWIRHEHEAYVAIPVAVDANLSSVAHRVRAVADAMARRGEVGA